MHRIGVRENVPFSTLVVRHGGNGVRGAQAVRTSLASYQRQRASVSQRCITFPQHDLEGIMAINMRKVLVGGVVAGVVLAILDFLINGVLLADQNMAAMEALNPALAASMENASIGGFIILDILFGLLLVWTYAAMRSRFGAGPKTAVIAAIQVWMVALLLYAFMTMVGMYSVSYFLVGAVTSLVMLVVAAIVGAMLYKEEAGV
jgi:hypothetical protein